MSSGDNMQRSLEHFRLFFVGAGFRTSASPLAAAGRTEPFPVNLPSRSGRVSVPKPNPQWAPKSVQVSGGGQELLAHAGRFCFPSSQSVSDESLCAVPLPTCFVSIFSPFLMMCTSAMA